MDWEPVGLRLERFTADPLNSRVPFFMPSNLAVDLLFHSLELIHAALGKGDRLPLQFVESFYFALRELNRTKTLRSTGSFESLRRFYLSWGPERVFRYRELRKLDLFKRYTPRRSGFVPLY